MSKYQYATKNNNLIEEFYFFKFFKSVVQKLLIFKSLSKVLFMIDINSRIKF